MVEFLKSVGDQECGCSREVSGGDQTGAAWDEGLLMKDGPDHSFVLEIESLPSVADKEGIRSLSRKGSVAGERNSKASEREASDASSKGIERGTDQTSPVGTTTIDMTSATLMEENNGGKRFYSRCNSSISRRSWIDPRRVFMFFATLSTMGTMVLIYFTLSISNITQEGAPL